MTTLQQPPLDELAALERMLAEAISAMRPTAHRVVQFEHGPEDDVLPFVFDFLESERCTVVNVLTLTRSTGIFREVVFRVRARPCWTGVE